MASTGRVVQISSQITNEKKPTALALLDDGTIKNLLEYPDREWNNILPINFSIAGRVIRQIAIGGKPGHGLAILDDGSIIKWIYDFDRKVIVSQKFLRRGGKIKQIGSGLNQSCYGARVKDCVTQIAQGFDHSLALLDNGTVRGWGDNTFGQRRDQNFLAEGKKIVQIAAGATHSLALLDDGTVRGWGNNANGRRENKDFSAEGRNIEEIAAGFDHSLAILDDGTVRGWGNNIFGKCNSQNFLGTAVAPAEGRVIQIAAGYNHSLALLDDGTVRRWGYTFDIENFKKIDFLESGKKIVQVEAGSIVLLDDGTIRCCADYSSKCKKENFKKIIVDQRINFEKIDLKTNFFISIGNVRDMLLKYNDIPDINIYDNNFNLLDKVYYIIDINNEIIKDAYRKKSVLNKKYLLDNGIMGCIDVDKRLDDYVIIPPPYDENIPYKYKILTDFFNVYDYYYTANLCNIICKKIIAWLILKRLKDLIFILNTSGQVQLYTKINERTIINLNIIHSKLEAIKKQNQYLSAYDINDLTESNIISYSERVPGLQSELFGYSNKYYKVHLNVKDDYIYWVFEKLINNYNSFSRFIRGFKHSTFYCNAKGHDDVLTNYNGVLPTFVFYTNYNKEDLTNLIICLIDIFKGHDELVGQNIFPAYNYKINNLIYFTYTDREQKLDEKDAIVANNKEYRQIHKKMYLNKYCNEKNDPVKINKFVKEMTDIESVCTADGKLKPLELNATGCYDDICLYETEESCRGDFTKYIYKQTLGIDFDTYFLKPATALEPSLSARSTAFARRGGYYNKYLKYKQKYLALKKQIF